MKVLFWVALPIVRVIYFRQSLLQPLLLGSQFFHNKGVSFLSRTPPNQWQWLYQSVFCGEPLSAAQKENSFGFIVLGLYPLLIMTGRILTAIETFLDRILFFVPPLVRKVSIGFVLFFFTVLCAFKAGIVRTFIQWVLNRPSLSKNKLKPADLQIVVISLCLFINPQWLTSISFQISCVSQLAFSIAGSVNSGDTRQNRSRFFTSCLFVLLTMPFILCFSQHISWLVIPASVIALPLFEFVLFPILLIGLIFRPSQFISDKILSSLFDFANTLTRFREPEIVLTQIAQKRIISWGFTYFALLYLLWRFTLFFYRRWRFQKNQQAPMRF
jgi:ComEC/Rec2-related protein